jgi:aminoacyl tRNA synthase complex-interacting multifunctional protein 1
MGFNRIAIIRSLVIHKSLIISHHRPFTSLLPTPLLSTLQVVEWLTFCVTELSPLLDDKLAKINDWLVSRTFLAGNHITLADLVVYGTVAPAATAFPKAQHGHFCNLLRWYDYIHNLADGGSLFPAAVFEKPKFVAPPPPTPAPKADKNGGADASKGKEKAAAGAAIAAVAVVADALVPDGAASKKDKKKDKKAAAAPAAAAPADAAAGPTVDMLDIRIGLITKVGPHPNADSLYLEEIDLGEPEGPRQVVSGLRKFVPEEKMQNRKVVVVCNLKPAKMREIMSYGMVLCASNNDHTEVDPINPPEGAAIGERVKFEGFSAEPEAVLNPKKKIFEKIAPDLVTDAGKLLDYLNYLPIDRDINRDRCIYV